MMPKPLVIRPEVIEELEQARDWYAARAPTLCVRFLKELRAVLESIERQPQRGAFYDDERCFRYRRLPKLPHLIIYRELDDCLEVLAAAHTSRKPGYWKDRS